MLLQLHGRPSLFYLVGGCFNTAGGRCCCNFALIVAAVLTVAMIVSIPQAVGVVATLFDGELGLETMQVSIPQAVGVVATGVYWFC